MITMRFMGFETQAQLLLKFEGKPISRLPLGLIKDSIYQATGHWEAPPPKLKAAGIFSTEFMR